jgi:hypothetical protein
MEMMVPSWTQYLLQQDRMTKADREIIEQAESLHVGPDPPEVRMYLGVNKELFSYKHKAPGRLASAREQARTPSTSVNAGTGHSVAATVTMRR